MEKKEILQIIRSFIIEIIKLNDVNITEESTLIGSVGEFAVGLSSIEFVKLIIQLESFFKIAIDFDVKLNTVGDIINYIIESKENDELKI